jgi:uncharacterized membrane protein
MSISDELWRSLVVLASVIFFALLSLATITMMSTVMRLLNQSGLLLPQFDLEQD